jgi:indoleamine 2,3-dioxygenase
MLLLSYLGHGYVWGEREAARRIPENLAMPWFDVAARLGRPPVLSYASYALDNWRRIDRKRPIEMGNLAILQNFLGGADEDWFILIHIDIEARAGRAMRAIPAALTAAARQDAGALTASLGEIEASLSDMIATLRRMPEYCDPYIYYHRVRPYIHGWKNNPALPDGLVYDGVDTYRGKPQKFRGETGAQSGIIPTIDAALGVAHGPDELRSYLMEMREYMPAGHRAFVEAIERRSTVRQVVTGAGGGEKSLTSAYDACLRRVEEFRSIHLEYAASYIFRQAQDASANPTSVGTGGTPFMPYLKKHRGETRDSRIGSG